MKDDSLDNLGGIASVIVGISYAVIGVTELLLPSALTVENTAFSPFTLFEARRRLLLTQYWAMTVGALFALAVIPTLSNMDCSKVKLNGGHLPLPLFPTLNACYAHGYRRNPNDSCTAQRHPYLPESHVG